MESELDIKYPLLIDGGLSNELVKLGCDLNQPLWTAMMLKTNPDAVKEVHLSYLRAGAQCISTASYQATFAGYRALGIDKVEASELMLRSIELCKKAVEQFLAESGMQNKLLISASIGPYGAYLADGSEYSGDYDIIEQELRDFHKEKITLFDRSKADILACETIPSYEEAKVLADLLADARKPSWISFSCKDEKHINDGTPIAKCVKELADHPTIFALGINCSKPSHIQPLIEEIKVCRKQKKIIVYPNSGELYDASTKSWKVGNDACFDLNAVRSWINAGADIIGGCCRVGPDMIKQISNILNQE